MGYWDDALFVFGGIAIVVGVGLYSIPAGIIVGGLLLMMAGFALAESEIK